MVVLVADEDVEDGAAELLFEVDGVQIEQADGLDRLFVAVGAGGVEVVVTQGGQGLHVDLPAG
ncbi:hypothetical protein D3C80_1642200 [compost metagenome]